MSSSSSCSLLPLLTTSKAFLIVFIWLVLWLLFPKGAYDRGSLFNPGGVIFDPVVIFIVCSLLGKGLGALTGVPPLILIFFFGLAWGNIPEFNYLSSGISKETRRVTSRIALANILLRTGLAISPKVIAKAKWNIILMSFLPLFVEIVVHGFVAGALYDDYKNSSYSSSSLWPFLQAAVVSPSASGVVAAVVMIIQQKGYTKTRGPGILLTPACGLDMSIGIWFANFVGGLIFPANPGDESVSAWAVIQGPVQILVGGIAGACLGLIFYFLVLKILWLEFVVVVPADDDGEKQKEDNETKTPRMMTRDELDNVVFWSTFMLGLFCAFTIFLGYFILSAGGGCVACTTCGFVVSGLLTQEASTAPPPPVIPILVDNSNDNDDDNNNPEEQQLDENANNEPIGSTTILLAGEEGVPFSPALEGVGASSNTANANPESSSSSRKDQQNTDPSPIQENEQEDSSSSSSSSSSSNFFFTHFTSPTSPTIISFFSHGDQVKIKLGLVKNFADLWDVLVMPCLFAFSASSLNIVNMFNPSTVGYAIATIVIAMICRTLATLACSYTYANMTISEWIIGSFCLGGKAFAQVALGGIGEQLVSDQISKYNSTQLLENADRISEWNRMSENVKNAGALSVMFISPIVVVLLSVVGPKWFWLTDAEWEEKKNREHEQQQALAAAAAAAATASSTAAAPTEGVEAEENEMEEKE